MKKIIFICVLFFSINIISAQDTLGLAQQNRIIKGERAFEAFSYLKARKIFEKVYAKGYVSARLLKQLGDSYYFTADYKKALKYYDLLLKDYNNIDTLYKLRFKVCSNTFENSKKNNIKTINSDYAIENAIFNTKETDYAPAFINDKLLFSSGREDDFAIKRVQDWNGEAFTDLYFFNTEDSTVVPLPKTINSKYNEGAVVYDSINKRLYFTRNNYSNRKKGFSKSNLVLLKIYSIDFINGEWKNLQELPINSDEFNTAHPALSEDRKHLFFSSDRPGGFGSSDLYKVEILGNNVFGTPENLGSTINSIARESFPFLLQDVLYFTSDRAEGFGGLDIFEYDFTLQTLTNLPQPINSPQDDFSLIINPITSKSYFTSNRKSGIGSDDIYIFNWKIEEKTESEIVLYDSETGEPLAFCNVEMTQVNNNKVREEQTNEKGVLDIKKIDKTTYIINVSKEGYLTDGIQFTFSEKDNNQIKIYLKREQKELAVGDDLSNALQIDNIYYDLDKFFIRKDAEVELMKIVLLMESYPKMQIAINSHTDSRQTKEYNMQLSINRAKAAYNWLIKNGIKANRLSFKGFGENKLLNNCKENVDCTEAEHQKNRRSEFIITKM